MFVLTSYDYLKGEYNVVDYFSDYQLCQNKMRKCMIDYCNKIQGVKNDSELLYNPPNH